MSDIENQMQALKALRVPFEKGQISRLPKPTKKQTDDVKADFKKGIRCAECGAWHHPDVVHLDYVGHAALTDRLLSVDPFWNWEFASTDALGQPIIDSDGGFWIKLTICGVTRLGYGDAQGKTGGNAMKERIGDALRNVAMRFGCALDLWHKGDLHSEDSEAQISKTDEAKQKVADYFLKYNSALSRNFDALNIVMGGIESEDLQIAAAAWYEMTEEDQFTIYALAPTKGGVLSTKQRETIKSTAFRQAYYGENNGN